MFLFLRRQATRHLKNEPVLVVWECLHLCTKTCVIEIYYDFALKFMVAVNYMGEVLQLAEFIDG